MTDFSLFSLVSHLSSVGNYLLQCVLGRWPPVGGVGGCEIDFSLFLVVCSFVCCW